MGVFKSAQERSVIHRILEEYGYVDKLLYTEDVFFYIEGHGQMDSVDDYVMRHIEYVYIKSPNYSYDSVIICIQGKEMRLKDAPPQAIALLYGKIQQYEREFEKQ